VGSTVAIYDGNKFLGNATVDGSGNWVLRRLCRLAKGRTALRRSLLMPPETTSSPFNVVVDTIAPDAPSTPVVTVNGRHGCHTPAWAASP
jgi:hypothetical protein